MIALEGSNARNTPGYDTMLTMPVAAIRMNQQNVAGKLKPLSAHSARGNKRYTIATTRTWSEQKTQLRRPAELRQEQDDEQGLSPPPPSVINQISQSAEG